MFNIEDLLDKKPNIKNKSIEDKYDCYSVNQYSSLITRLDELQQKLRLSSKHNTKNNNIFKTFNKSIEKDQKEREFLKFSNTNSTFNSSIENNNNKIQSQYSNSSNEFNQSNNYHLELEEEKELKSKLSEIEIQKKKNFKGLTSMFISRNQRKILVNSISNTQYMYDPLYFDTAIPQEYKGHKSSYFVKSVLSPCSNYILSGSKDACIYIWDIKDNLNPIKMNGFHNLEVSY